MPTPMGMGFGPTVGGFPPQSSMGSFPPMNMLLGGCLNCGSHDHFTMHCPRKKKGITIIEDITPPTPTPPSVPPPDSTPRRIHPGQPKVAYTWEEFVEEAET